jgi:hypothetical protein
LGVFAAAEASDFSDSEQIGRQNQQKSDRFALLLWSYCLWCCALHDLVLQDWFSLMEEQQMLV